MNFTEHEKNMVLELCGAITLAIAFFHKDSVSFIAGFLAFWIILDLFNTNLRKVQHG